MNEISKFLRYTAPGLIFASELLVAFIITDTEILVKLIHAKDTIGNIELVISALLASGAVGYFFSQLYFGFYWLWENSIFAIDHRNVFIDFDDKIDITDSRGNQIVASKLSKRGAQTILTQYWFAQMKISESIRGIEPLVGRFYDIMHSTGTTFVATFISLFAWLCINYSTPSSSGTIKDTIVIFAWIFLIALICINYYRTKKSLECFINSTFLETIQRKYDETSSKVQIIACLKNLKESR